MSDENQVNSVEIIPPNEMLEMFEGINIAAPMVRYSKLPFRHLISRYNCHITHTPMILAQEFSRSAQARSSDFSTSKHERGVFTLRERRSPSLTDDSQSELRGDLATSNQRCVRGALIAQFAATDPQVFADAVELIHPHVDGVDLNCGCPQAWAYKEHIGSWLLRRPDHVRDLIRAAKNRVGSSYPISIKIRVDTDAKRTAQLIETAIHVGVSHVTVHGRTRYQASTEKVSLSSIAFAVSCAKSEIPVVANGDVWTIGDAIMTRKQTGASAVMSARGLLGNPALFAGFKDTPAEAVMDFVRFSVDHGLLYPLFHRHLCYMLESRFHALERSYFNTLVSYAGIVDHLQQCGLKIT